MKHSYIDFSEVPFLSKKDVSYQTDFDTWRDFAKHEPSIENFEDVIKEKSIQLIDRKLLVDTLSKQYELVKRKDVVESNIKKLLLENTFTITTAHQPSLLTGPLYYIYKICSVINLCSQLSIKYPQYNFVPVFVSGGEDHDFEEVNHLSLFNQEFVWEHTHDQEPVGRMNLDGLSEVVGQIKEKLRPESDANVLLSQVNSFIGNSKSYAETVFKLVNELFGKNGLVFLNMDNASLKSSFSSILKQEIFQRPSEQLVKTVQDKIVDKGFKSQAHAREINVFYFTESGQRKRIELEDGEYKIVDTNLSFSQESMERLIDESPENFSPNVILRPIYQEFILPNLAYVGGGGEIAYWLERKTQFEHFNIPFPMLIRRNSVYLTDKSVNRNLKKLELTVTDFFAEEHQIVHNFIEENEDSEISLGEEKELLRSCYDSLKLKVSEIDKSLNSRIEAHLVKNLKSFDQLEFRLRKSLKDKHQVNVDRIQSTYGKIFPQQNLQERKVNFLEFLDKYGLNLIDSLIETLNPFEKRFMIIDMDSE